MKRNGKKYADNHIRNACPVLTSESSGGTGFFYKSGGDVYLVTAKHNVIPSYNEYEEGFDRGEKYSPQLWVLVRTSSDEDGGETWLRKEIDIRNRKVFFKKSFDAIAIPIAFDPEDHGYTVYDSEDIQRDNIEKKGASLLSWGFDKGSFSRWDPDNIDYTDPGKPRMVSLSNPRTFDHCGCAVDVSNSGDYLGMSGSPLLAEGLVGIHTSNSDEKVYFTKAEVIPEILNSPREIEEKSPMEAFVKNVRRSTAGGD